MKASLGAHMARTLATLTIPQGYTLSIAGTFGLATHRYGAPFLAEAWGFVAGAVVAFVVLAAVSGRHLAGPANLPQTTLATFNVVPAASVLLGAGVVYPIPWPAVGFPAAGLVAVGSYVLMVSAFFAVVARVRPARAIL